MINHPYLTRYQTTSRYTLRGISVILMFVSLFTMSIAGVPKNNQHAVDPKIKQQSVQVGQQSNQCCLTVKPLQLNLVERIGIEPMTPCLQSRCSPIWANAPLRCMQFMVGRGGLEPPTSRLSGVRSNHLSYRPRQTGRSVISEEIWGRLGPTDWQLCLLPLLSVSCLKQA